MPTKFLITIGLIAGLAFVGAILRRHRHRRPRTPRPHERPFDDTGVRARLRTTAEHRRWPHPGLATFHKVTFHKRERPPEQ